jgi:Uma2 family endonuclease
MSIGPSPSDPQAVLDQEPKRLLSVDEYHRMIAAGVFDPDEHIELLEGVIVEMSPQLPRHAEIIRRLCDPRFVEPRGDVVVQAQLPLTLGPGSEPEPDVAVVPRRPEGYAQKHPSTALLVVEVAGESLRKDRLVKAAIYARASIPEYVVVNLADGCLEVNRDPDPGAGEYRSRTILHASDRFVSVAVPGYDFEVGQLLG